MVPATLAEFRMTCPTSKYPTLYILRDLSGHPAISSVNAKWKNRGTSIDVANAEPVGSPSDGSSAGSQVLPAFIGHFRAAIMVCVDISAGEPC